MRIEINGAGFEIRGLRLAEISQPKFRKLGYGRFRFNPQLPPDSERLDEFLGDVMDVALKTVLGPDGYAAVDAAGGVRGLQQVWTSILSATYGLPDLEKNSAGAGNGKPTPSAAITAEPAASAAPDAAETAHGADPPS